MERRGCYCLSRARAPAEGSAAGGGGAEHEQRHRELRAMRLKALKLRAAEEGVGEEELAERCALESRPRPQRRPHVPWPHCPRLNHGCVGGSIGAWLSAGGAAVGKRAVLSDL